MIEEHENAISPTPTVVEVACALRKAEQALTRQIILNPGYGVNLDSLMREALEESETGLLAKAFVEARNSLAQHLVQQSSKAMNKADEVCQRYFRATFGAELPATITLPDLHGGRAMTETIENITSIYEVDGEITGTLRTLSHGGRSHDTRGFSIRSGKLYFLSDCSI